MLDENDRERLKALHAWLRYEAGEAGITVDHFDVVRAHMDEHHPHWALMGYDNLVSLARQEIARLEALETTPAVAPDPGWHTIAKINSAGIITKPGDTLSVEAEQKWHVVPGKTHFFISRDAYAALCGEPTEQSLDDFMRERDRKAESAARDAYLNECSNAQHGPYLAKMKGEHHETKPASRELVVRMVREATTGWNLGLRIKIGNGLFVSLRDAKGDPVTGSSWSHALRSYADLCSAIDDIRGDMAEAMARLCPACNGQGKTRGYFFGEKQCSECEGTGVR